MNAKNMLLKIYYELDEFEALTALISSFKRFLNRKSIVAYQKQIYTNMILLTEKLIHILPNDQTKKAQLRQEIENSHPLTEKPWLLEQLEQL